MKGFRKDQRGVEPTAMKIMAGVILLAIGLGIGIVVYKSVGTGVSGQLSFNVNLSPSSATIGRPTTSENTKDVSVSVDRVLDYAQTVTLSATGTSTGITVTFSPGNGTPSFGSTMTIRVDNTAGLGKTTLTIRGRGADGVEKTASFELTVA